MSTPGNPSCSASWKRWTVCSASKHAGRRRIAARSPRQGTAGSAVAKHTTAACFAQHPQSSTTRCGAPPKLMAIESFFALAPSDTDMTHPTALPNKAALDAHRPRPPDPSRLALARARRARAHRARLGPRRVADRCQRPRTARRLRRPVVRERRLRAGERGAGRGRADAPAAVRDRLLPLQQRAGHPPGREAGADHARLADPRVPHARRLRGGRCRGALHRAVLQRHRPAGEEAVHRAGARLPRLLVHRRGPDRAAGVPPRLRPAAADAALHPVALRRTAMPTAPIRRR